MAKPKKTLVVGFDAACWEYVKPLLYANRMPVMAKLMDLGVSGIMKSTMPPWTPTAWSSIITGKNPGKHGIFDMLLNSPSTNDSLLANASIRKGTPFWVRLNQKGIKTGMVNIPFTYPPKPVDGFLVCGFGTPNTVSEISYPKGIQAWLKEEYGDTFKPEVDTEILNHGTPSEIFNTEVRQQVRFVDIASKLISKYPVEVLVINLMLPDHANHKMPTMDLVNEAYVQTDADLGTLLDEFHPDDVILFSDHGSSRLKGDFRLDLWLRDHGYLVTLEKTFVERSAAINWLLLQYAQKTNRWTGWKEKFGRRFLKEYLLRAPDWLTAFFWRRLERVYPRAREYVQWSEKPDFSRTKVFPGSVFSGLLYFNTMGMESNTVVSSERRRQLANEISEKLLAIEDPETGEPLFSNTYFSDDLYIGQASTRVPDLVLDAYDREWNIRSKSYSYLPVSMLKTYFVKETRHRDFGWHSKDGLFVFSGKSFLKRKALQEANLVDIPASLLHLYDIPIPDDYDGSVLKELMVNKIQTQAIGVQEGDKQESESLFFKPEEAELLKDHLKALGYLD